MNKKQLQIIASKYANRSANKYQRALLESFFEKLQINNKNLIPHLGDDCRNRILNSILTHKLKKEITFYPRVRKYAAVAAILIMTFGITYFPYTFSEPELITILTRRGEKTTLILPDSSIVMLNSGSSIRYPRVFEGTRNIILEGEAFFKVKKNAAVPFIVSVNSSKVKVLGTSFNINGFKKNSLKVSVNTGKVSVSSPWQPNKEFLLETDQQLNLQEGLTPKFSINDSRNYSAWTEKTIFLDSSTLSETANIIENWYDVTIAFQEPELKELRISGKFRDESLKNVLKSIALLKELKIEETTKNHFVIRRKKK